MLYYIIFCNLGTRAFYRADIENFHNRMPMLESCTNGIINDKNKPLSNVVGNLLERSKQLNHLSQSITHTKEKLVKKGGKNVSFVLAGRKRRFNEMANQLGNNQMHARFQHERRKMGNVTVETAIQLRAKLDSLR